MDINTKLLISLQKLRMKICNEQVLLQLLQSWASVAFTSITVRVWQNLSYFGHPVSLKALWLMMILHVDTFISSLRCPADRNKCRRRTVSSRISADAITCRHRPVPVRYVTTHGKMLKIVRYPGNSLSRRWFANRWNRTAAVFCDHIIRHINYLSVSYKRESSTFYLSILSCKISPATTSARIFTFIYEMLHSMI